MPIRFETEWVAAEEVQGPELASTWASLLIRVDDTAITRVVDRRAQTVRDHIFVPLYPLAESLVTNWWFLWHEVANPAKGDDTFARRHALVSGSDGYAFPKLQIASSGSRTLLTWTPDSRRWAMLDYQDENRIWVDRHEFRESCTDIVDRVVRRLLSCGIEATLLQEEWATIQAADQDESQFCKTAAGLGWDPYDLDDSQRRTVLELDGALDEAVFDEAVAVLDVAHLEANVAAIRAALDPGNCTDLPLDHIRAVRGALPLVTNDNPWEAGCALARQLRGRLGLDGEPLRTTEALGEALRERPAQLVDATRPRDFGAAELLNGVVTLNDDGLPAFAFRHGPEHSRRFHFCRGLAEVVASPDSPALLTQARSERQQRSRAFAAEFLAPAATLRARVPRPVLDEEDIDGLAADFGVSSWLIRHQVQNHQIARLW